MDKEKAKNLSNVENDEQNRIGWQFAFLKFIENQYRWCGVLIGLVGGFYLGIYLFEVAYTALMK